MNKRHVRAYQITMTVHAAADATVDTIKSLVRDLEWVGGCRDPHNDPAFDGMTPSNIIIKRQKELDRGHA